MFDHIPVGVGSKGIIPMNAQDLEEALEMGMDWSLRQGQLLSHTLTRNTVLTKGYMEPAGSMARWSHFVFKF